MSAIQKLLMTLGASLIGAAVFYLVNIPLPFLLGPIAAILFYKFALRKPVYWPSEFRQGALALMGYMIGITFTRSAAASMVGQLPIMLICTVISLVLSVLFGIMVARLSKVSGISGILGNIPGGLPQMVALSEEIESADETVVTFMQSLRLMAVIFVVPFVTVHGLYHAPTQGMAVQPAALFSLQDYVSIPWYSYLVYLIGVVGGAWGAVRLRVPIGILTGPMLVSAVISAAGVPAPHVPQLLVMTAQVCIGAYLGNQMKSLSLMTLRSLGIYTVISSVGLIVTALLLGWILSEREGMRVTTAFLSVAPGGIAEMSLTAAAVHADLTTVSGYQFVRVCFVMLIIPIVMGRWAKRSRRTQSMAGIESKESTDVFDD